MSKLTEIGSASKLAQVGLENLQKKVLDAQKQREIAAQNYRTRPQDRGGFLGGVGYLGEKVGAGFMAGVEGFWDFAAGGIADAFGADKWAEEQIANKWFGDWYNNAGEWYNPSEGWQNAGNVAQGIGSSLPALIPSAAVAVGAGIATVATGGTAAPVTVPAAVTTIANLAAIPIAIASAGGQAVSEAYEKTGKLTGEEWGYGALVGVTEGGIEGASTLIGLGAGKIAKALTGSARASASAAARTGARSVVSGVLRTAGSVAGDFASEAVEEGLAEIMSPYYARATYDPNAKNATAEEVAYAAIVGGVAGVLLGGVGKAAEGGAKIVTAAADGKAAFKSGTAKVVLDTAKLVTEAEENNPSGYKVFQQIAKDYRSLEDVDEEKYTNKHYRKLAELQELTAVTRLLPTIEESAVDILMRPQEAAERFAAIGVTNITAEGLTAGLVGVNPNSAEGIYAIRKALSNNPALTAIAVADAAGKMMLQSSESAGVAARGISEEQYNLLQSSQNAGAIAQKLGIGESLEGVDYATFAKAREGYAQTEDGKKYISDTQRAIETANGLKENTDALPEKVGDTARYGSYAIIKDGDRYRIYDYNTGNLSFSLSENQANEFVRRVTGKTEAKTEDKPKTEDAKDEKAEEKPKAEKKPEETPEEKVKRVAKKPAKETPTEVKTTEEKTTKVAEVSREKNGVTYEGFTFDEKNATDAQRATVAAAELLYKLAPGVKVHVYETVMDGGRHVVKVNGKAVTELAGVNVTTAPNGFFAQGNHIYIDINATRGGKQVALYTLSHEVTHYLYANAKKSFFKIANFLTKKYSKTQTSFEALQAEKKEALKKQYNARGEKVPPPLELSMLATEEVVCDAMSRMLADTSFYEVLAEMKGTDTAAHKSFLQALKATLGRLKELLKGYSYAPSGEAGDTVASFPRKAYRKLQKLYAEAIMDAETHAAKKTDAKFSYSSIGQSFFGREATIAEMESGAYKTTEAYKAYVDKCVGTMTKTIGMTEAKARKEVESSIDGIVRVAIAAKKAGYDIADIGDGRTDSKGRMLFSSLEPNSDYFTSSDISTICDKRKTFSEIHDEIVSREEALGVPKGKRFFSNISNYYVLHDILAEKGMTAPCRECYVESMRKNLAPMAQAFLELVQETDVNNKNNKQLWAKGKQKTGNLELREKLLEAIASEEDPLIGIADLNEELLSTEHGITRLRLQAPMIYEAFNSFYGQSKPKMPKSPTPFRFGELTAMLTDENGNIKVGLIKKIKDTGGFRLQSYSDFQIVNFVDVLQVIFEAGTLGLNGHAYTKVPAFLIATDKTNLKRNISVFTYEDNGQWKIDKYDSFPGTLEELYEICKADTTGNTGIIVVTQNAENAAWVMANPHIWYFIGYHKSGQSMSVVRDKTVREGGRAIKGYANVKDHTRQQSEVWAKTVTIDGKTHKAGTKVKKSISIYDFWDFDNKSGLSQKKLLEKNLKAYIDRCVDAGYHPRFREYLMNNSAVIEDIVKYSKEFGVDVTAEDVAFKYKGYTVPYGYAACLGDFSMFDQNGNAVPIERLSLADYDFDAAVKFFADSESLRRTELLQQIANDGERDRYITGDRKGWTTDQIREEIERIKGDIVDSIVPSAKFSEREDIDSDVLSQYNEKNTNGGKHGKESGSDTVILAERGVSTTRRSDNALWKPSKNTALLSRYLGNLENDFGQDNIKAGESGWLGTYEREHDIEGRGRRRARGFVQSVCGKLRRTELKTTDTIGRALPKKVYQNFQETVLKNTDGTILSLWHWTPNKFLHFKYGDIGFHAGLLTSADKIREHKGKKGEVGYYKELYVNCRNPLVISDDLWHWTPYILATYCSTLFALDVSVIEALPGCLIERYDTPASARLRDILKGKGYDSIIYPNTLEDGISVIVFDDEQIYTVAENGVDLNDHDADSTVRYSDRDDSEFADQLEWVGRDKREYTPSFGERVRDIADRTYAELFDAQIGIERGLVDNGMSKQEANALVQRVRSSGSAAQSMLGQDQYNHFGGKHERVGDGLTEILKPTRNWSQTMKDEFDFYLLNWLNVDAMTLEARTVAALQTDIAQAQVLSEEIAAMEDGKEKKAKQKELGKLDKKIKAMTRDNRPIFKANEELGRDHDITAEESEAIVKKLEEKHPAFKDVAAKIYGYLKNSMQKRVDAGLVTQEAAERMAFLYPHYVPVQYDIENGYGFAPIRGAHAMAVSQTIRRAIGGKSAILKVADAIAQQTIELERAGNINILLNSLYPEIGEADTTQEADDVNEDEVSASETAVLKPTAGQITFFKNGERVTVKIPDGVEIGINDLRTPSVDTKSPIERGLAWVMKLFREGVTTYSPVFTPRNAVRDIQDAGLNSKHARLFAKHLRTAPMEILKNSENWRLYRSIGAFSSSVFQDTLGAGEGYAGFESIALMFKDGDVTPSKLKKAFNLLGKSGKAYFKAVENVNNFVEQIPRFAEFCASLEAGDSVDVALYNSAEVTTNFGRHGKLSKKLNAVLIPFLNANLQGFDKMLRNVGDAVTAPQAVRATVKLLTKAVLVGMTPMLVNMLMYGDDDEYEALRDTDKENYFLIKVSDDSFIKIPRGRVASAIGGILYRGSKIAKGEDPDLKGYAENVWTNLSPVESMSRDIFSPLRDVASNTTWYGSKIEGQEFDDTRPRERYDESTSSIAIALGKVFNQSPKKIHYLLDQYTGVVGDLILPATSQKENRGLFSGNLTIDSVLSNKWSTKFYELYDETNYKKTEGDESATYEIKYLNRVKKAIKTVNDEIDAIRTGEGTNGEKLQKVRVLRALVNEQYKSALDSIEAVREAIENTKGIEDETLRDAEITRIVFGAETAIKQYDKKVYEKYSALADAGVNYDDIYDFYFSSYGIESDTDKYGNVIDGSKRKKVFDLINAMDIPVEQKVLLADAKGYTVKDGDIKGVSASAARKILGK